jgi:hypothetical protein
MGVDPRMRKYPATYVPGGYDLETGLESVGRGWQDLVRRAFQALPEGHMIVQVKEKFGSLRIYFEPNERAYEDLLDDLAAESLTICEVCGKPGRLRTDRYWQRTLCDAHAFRR